MSCPATASEAQGCEASVEAIPLGCICLLSQGRGWGMAIFFSNLLRQGMPGREETDSEMEMCSCWAHSGHRNGLPSKVDCRPASDTQVHGEIFAISSRQYHVCACFVKKVLSFSPHCSWTKWTSSNQTNKNCAGCLDASRVCNPWTIDRQTPLSTGFFTHIFSKKIQPKKWKTLSL